MDGADEAAKRIRLLEPGFFLYRNGVANTVMTRNMFQLLLTLWHFSDNTEEAVTNDKQHKIRHIVNSLVANYATSWRSSRNR